MHFVELVEVLQADAILLRDAVHGFTGTEHMHDVVLVRPLVLLLQVKDVAHLQGISLVEVVVLAELLLADVEFLGNGLPAVSCPYHDVEQIVGDVGLMRIRVLLEPLQVVLLVVLVEFVQLDDADELVGITGIGGISGFLQPPRPTFVVSDFQLEERSVTRTTDQEFGMVFVRVLGVLVGTETFATGIVVMTHGLPPPVASTFDAEMVV